MLRLFQDALNVARLQIVDVRVCLCAAVWLLAGNVDDARAQVQPEPTAAMTEEQRAEESIKNLRYLVLPQQKLVAKRLIEQYPNTRIAGVAREILAELELYEDEQQRVLAEQERARKVIQQYWDARRSPPPVAQLNPVTITNNTDETLLYQVKWPGVVWLGPYSIQPGATHSYNDALTYRRITREGVALYSLTPGQHYVLQRPADGAMPQLYRAAD